MNTYSVIFGRLEPWTRKGIAAVLAPATPYKAGSAWQTSRAVRFGNGPNYVLFASLPKEGQPSAGCDHLDGQGTITWHSGTMDKFNGNKARELAGHNPEVNEVILFARAGQGGPYYHLGRLGHPTHVTGTDKPFQLAWELLDIKPGKYDFVRLGMEYHAGSMTDHVISEPPDQPIGHNEPAPEVKSRVWEPQHSQELEPTLHPVESPDYTPAPHHTHRQRIDEDEKKEIYRMLHGGTISLPSPAVIPVLVAHESPWQGKLGGATFATRFLKEVKNGHLALDVPATEMERVIASVVQHERKQLVKAGQPDLAQKVHTGEEGNFPVVYSIDPALGPFPILVNATTGPATTPFFLSNTEIDFLKAAVPSARIYRVFAWNSSAPQADFFVIRMPFYAEGVEI